MSNPGELSSRFIVGVRVGSGMVDGSKDRLILLRIEAGLSDGTITPDIFIEATEPLPPDPPDPPPPEDTILFGINTWSGFGGVALDLPPASLITGDGASDWTINSEGMLCPSGTYGAVKTFSKTAGQSYTLTFSDTTERTITLVAATSHWTAMAADTSSSFQLRAYLQTAGVSGDFIGRPCLLNPTRGTWRITPPAAGYGGAITISGEVPVTGTDADGNPNRGSTTRIGSLLFDGKNLPTMPITFVDITFDNDIDGPHSNFLGLTPASARGIGITRCWVGNASNVSLANRADGATVRNATALQCHFERLNTGLFIDGSNSGAQTLAQECVFKNCSDAIKRFGQNVRTYRNFVFAPLVAPGAHPDADQHPGTTTTYTLPNESEEDIVVCNESTGSQGIFWSDTNSPNWLDGAAITNPIIIGGSRAITITRGRGASVSRPLAIEALGKGFGSAFIDMDTCTTSTLIGGVSNGFSLGTTTAPDKVTLARTLSAYQTAMPNFPADLSSLTNRAAVIAACTPANKTVAQGGFKLGDGTYACPLNASGNYQ